LEPKILSAEEIQEQHHWLIDGNTGVIPNNCLRCINKTAKAQLAKDIEWHTEEVEREVNDALLKQYETFEARIPARIAEARDELIEEIEKQLFYVENDSLVFWGNGYLANKLWQQLKQKYQKEG
jgi:hypothetical protein